MADTGTPSGIGWPESDNRVDPELGDASTAGAEERYHTGMVQPVGWPDLNGRIEPASIDGQNGGAVVSRETFEPQPEAGPPEREHPSESVESVESVAQSPATGDPMVPGAEATGTEGAPMTPGGSEHSSGESPQEAVRPWPGPWSTKAAAEPEPSSRPTGQDPRDPLAATNAPSMRPEQESAPAGWTGVAEAFDDEPVEGAGSTPPELAATGPGSESSRLAAPWQPVPAAETDPLGPDRSPTTDDPLVEQPSWTAGPEPVEASSSPTIAPPSELAVVSETAPASETGVIEDLDETMDDDAEPTDVLPRLPLLTDSLPLPEHGRVLVVANQKGGVGKTTTAVNLAAALVAYGARVLVVDLDPQGNASTALGIAHQEDVEGVYEVLIGEGTMAEVVRETPGVPGLYGAPATIKLAGAEIELVSFVARESRLKRPLESYLAAVTEAGERFDYVLIDCPPSLGLLTLNALVAAKEVLIPIQCEYYALEGVSQLLRTIELVQRELNQELWVSTVILTMYDGRTRLAAGVAEEVRAHFGDRVLRTAVPRSVRISEAPSYGQTVITHDPTSSGALSYLEAAREFALL